ncbi:MAG: DUF4350 domain-containing protein [Actinomycetota bacterium]
MTPRARQAAVAVAGFVMLIIGCNLLARGLDDSVGGREPTGASNSTYASTGEGLAGYFELLTRWGHPVDRIRGELGDANLDPSHTLVIVAPAVLLSEQDEQAVELFVEFGGRLVLAGVDGGVTSQLLGDRAPAETDGAEHYTQFASSLPLLSRVVVDGDAAYESSEVYRVLVREDAAVLAMTARVGAGEVVLLADPSLVQNESLVEDDNAALAVELAGEDGRTVVFAEGVHGYGKATGLDAIPTRWRYALAFLALAAVVFSWARGRRLGPPDRPRRDLPPARSEYITALGTTLGRTGDRASALATVAAHGRAQIARRAALPADADRTAFDAAARQLGLDDDEIAALWSPPGDDAGVMQLGRAVARASDERAKS